MRKKIAKEVNPSIPAKEINREEKKCNGIVISYTALPMIPIRKVSSFIIRCNSNLILGDKGRVFCTTNTYVRKDYLAIAIMELQRYNGEWTTIKTWFGKDFKKVSLLEDWYIIPGYYYRLRVTHQAVNGDSAQESYIGYSNMINYNSFEQS